MSRRGGIIQVQVNGEIYEAKGDFECNLGRPKREAIVGADGVHGYKETPQVAFVEGKFTDRGDIDVNTLLTIKDATVTVAYANGKTFVLGRAWYAGDGNINTGEGEIDARFEGLDAEEVPA